MEPFEYSVIIRTVGKANEKYQKLLDSIAKLEPQPKQVLVVLPEGYPEPAQQLGWETFCYCPKGMVTQRLHGIDQCQTPYALICDDDVSFGEDFVRKLYEPLRNGAYQLSAAPLYSFLPAASPKAVYFFLCGAACPTVFHKNRYVSVLNTTGYSYNRKLDPKKRKYYDSQSLPWTCFFADVNALRRIGLEEEIWLNDNIYAAYDDQTMFYKAWLRGIRSAVVVDAAYVHEDGKTSPQDSRALTYCICRNRWIFWHRFLFGVKKNPLQKAWSAAAFGYLLLWTIIRSLTKRGSKEIFRLSMEGYRHGRQYTKSQAYRDLPRVY